jgi:adenylate cyclase
MGFFGAPLTLTDHALRSCKTALEMRKILPEINADIIKRGLEPIDFRVGIATGEVLVGNIGSEERFNYTVLGDTVNLASRLEATSKEYGTHIIVAEGTYLQVKENFFFRKLDCITVKGKYEPIGIYELIADIRDTTIET